MKLKEAQLLGVLGLIAVGIILLCMWGGGGDKSDPTASDRTLMSEESGVEPSVHDLYRELTWEAEARKPAAAPLAPARAVVTVGGSAPVSEEVRIRTAIDQKMPQQIPLTPGKAVVPGQAPAAGSAVLPLAEPAQRTHIVQKGETLADISKKYYGTSAKWPLIQDANKSVDPRALRIGMKLVIPAVKGAAASEPVIAAIEPAAQAPSLSAVSAQKSYTVQQGDSLFRIAERFYGDGSRWREIQAANKAQLPDADRLKVGMVLVIP